MTASTIVVTTPTGSIGSKVFRMLAEHDVRLRVVVRDGSRLPDGLDSVEVFEGSHGNRAVLSEALDGADALFWLTPPNPTAASVIDAYAGFVAPAVPAMAEQQDLRVVGVTALGRNTKFADRSGYVTGSLAVDDMIGGAGIAYRALAMPSFMDNLLRQAGPIATTGELSLPYRSDLSLPIVATQDIATVAVGLLTDQTWDGVEEHAVLGAEDISPAEMADTMSEVLGRPIRLRTVAIDTYRQNLVENGFSEAMAAGMADMAAAKNQGIDKSVERTPDNTTPTTFRQWCTDVLAPAVAGAS